MIYFVVFLLVLLFTYWAEVSLSHHSRAFFYVFSSVAILIPVLLAGFRDSGIGTDTIIYVDKTFEAVQYCQNWQDFWELTKSSMQSMELVYLLLNYVALLLFNTVNGVYFLASLVTILFFYKVAYDNRKKAHMWLVMAFFCFLMYNMSFNVVRQCMSLSMSLYAFKYVEERKWWPMAIWFLIIANTHNTGMIWILILGMYYVCQINSTYMRNFLKCAGIILVIFLFIYYEAILFLLVAQGIIPSRYEMYFGDSQRQYGLSGAIIYFCLFIVCCLLAILIKVKSEKRNIDVYLYNQLIITIGYVASGISIVAMRVVFYFMVCDYIFLPRMFYTLSKKRYVLSLILQWVVICLIVYYWYYLIILNNENETYPYTSKILGIGI